MSKKQNKAVKSEALSQIEICGLCPPFSPGLLEALTDLHRTGFDRPWPHESLQRTLQSSAVRSWGAFVMSDKGVMGDKGDKGDKGDGSAKSRPSKLDPNKPCLRKPIGFLTCQWVAQEVEILTFTVAPSQRGKGVGAALLETLIASATANALSRIFLEVEATNDAALHLYTRAGFMRIGVRKDYYAGTDAIVMEYSL